MVKRRGISDPLKRLPVGDDPDIIHGNDSVEERDETLLVVWLGEPSRMVEQPEWSSERVVAYFNFFQHFFFVCKSFFIHP